MVRYRWEMGITREEFLRLLPAAVSGERFEANGDTVRGAAWALRIAQRAPRRIALISSPVLEVELDVEAPGEEAATFASRFLLGYQRAGG